MKDVLIGAVDGYGWNQIKPWAESIREVGFTGDVYLIVYRANEDFSEQAAALNIELYPVEHTPYNTPIVHAQKGSPTQAHNLRFYHAWELLTRLDIDDIRYRHVILTDVSDVYFQKNPQDFIKKIIFERVLSRFILAPSEGIRYADEEWGKDNLIKGFGELMWEFGAKEWQSCNVGTIAGTAKDMRNLFEAIFRMTEGRYYPSDQSSFNVLIRNTFKGIVEIVPIEEGWAAQIGTTLDPTKAWLWDRCNEPKPTIDADFQLKTATGDIYTIVHQWPREPKLRDFINGKYNLG